MEQKKNKSEAQKRKPSTAANPDLDWSQIRETVLMINLALLQVDRSLNDGSESINTLSELFTSLVGNIKIISMASKNLSESKEKETIIDNCREIDSRVNEAIVAFQFYDKLAQRLSHVCFSLDALGELISKRNRLYNPYEWQGLQEMIKSRYNIDTDRAMFDALLSGASIEEALMVAEKQKQKVESNDNVELF